MIDIINILENIRVDITAGLGKPVKVACMETGKGLKFLVTTVNGWPPVSYTREISKISIEKAKDPSCMVEDLIQGAIKSFRIYEAERKYEEQQGDTPGVH